VERQRQFIAAGGMTVGALAIVAGVLFWPKSEPSASAQGAPGQPGAPKQGQKPAPAGQKAGAPAPASPAGGIPGAIPGVGAARGAAPGAAPGAVPGAAQNVVYKPPFRPRKDPFALKWKIPPPPPYVFNEIQPVRVASFQVTAPPPPNTEVREVPSRRVSGIMSGDGVFAIMESEGGEIEIVKPGSETKDGYKVVSIGSDTVTLKKKVGNVTYTQVVPLTDILPGQQPQIGGGGRFSGGRFGGPGGGGPTASGAAGIAAPGGLSGPGGRSGAGGGRRDD
jgi:hypothetical protein